MIRRSKTAFLSILTLSLCGMLAGGLPVALAQDEAAADSLAEEGLDFEYPHLGGENMSDAERIVELNAWLLDNPADGKAWNDLGVLYAAAADFPLARDAFIRAVQTKPDEGDFHRNLGLAFSRLEMFEMAVAEFHAYRSFDELGGVDYWRLIGGAQVRAGMIEEAKVTFQDGIDFSGPDLYAEGLRLVLALNKVYADEGDDQAKRDLLQEHTPAALKFLKYSSDPEAEGVPEARSLVNNRVAGLVEDGKVLEQSGLLPEAAAAFKEAHELDPTRDDLLPRLVDVYLKSGESMDARVTARLARDAHPDQAGTWIASGKVYEKSDRLSDAADAYQKAFAIDPSLEDLRVAIGNLLMRVGRDKEASEFLRAGVNSSDTKPEVVYNYAVSLIREKKYNAAIASLRSVVRDRPDMFQAWSALAQCYRATKQYGPAVGPYQKALEMKPDAKLAYNLGYCAMKAKRHDTAEVAYLHALQLDPGMIEARYNLSLNFMDAKRYEQAVLSFDSMLEIEPDSYRVYYSQGLSYYYLERFDEALEAYDLAMEQKETSNLLNNIGLVYDKLGKKKKAQSYYKQAKDLK
jgi:tetratricopeptide (TPR) repeat protein